MILLAVLTTIRRTEGTSKEGRKSEHKERSERVKNKEGIGSDRGSKGFGSENVPTTTCKLHTKFMHPKNKCHRQLLARPKVTVGEAHRIRSGRDREALGEASPEPRGDSFQGLLEPPQAHSESLPDQARGLVQICDAAGLIFR